MRKVIVTDLTRFSQGNPDVCIAAIDVKTGECIRPMPYLKSEKCKELGIHPGAILKGDLEYITPRTAPHNEDASYNKLKFKGACTGAEFKQILDNSLSDSVVEGFKLPFSAGQKHIPHDAVAACSIITIKVNPNQLEILENQFKPGKVKATFTDLSGHRFNYLSITDRGFHDFAKNHQDDGKLHQVRDFIQQQEHIYLRIGLSRVWQVGDRNGFWLQVNGIYTFPHFYEEIRSYEK